MVCVASLPRRCKILSCKCFVIFKFSSYLVNTQIAFFHVGVCRCTFYLTLTVLYGMTMCLSESELMAAADTAGKPRAGKACVEISHFTGC